MVYLHSRYMIYEESATANQFLIQATLAPTGTAMTLLRNFIIGGSCNLQVSHGVSPANDSKQDDHDGDHQKNVYESADGIGGDEPQEPQDEQNDSDGI
jgi:hypothetical protein